MKRQINKGSFARIARLMIVNLPPLPVKRALPLRDVCRVLREDPYAFFHAMADMQHHEYISTSIIMHPMRWSDLALEAGCMKVNSAVT